HSLEALDDQSINLDLVRSWFLAQLLKLAGHTPNLKTQKDGQKLAAGQKYDFDFDTMAFQPGKTYSTDQIKFLRLLFSGNEPMKLQKIQSVEKLASQLYGFCRAAAINFIRI